VINNSGAEMQENECKPSILYMQYFTIYEFLIHDASPDTNGNDMKIILALCTSQMVLCGHVGTFNYKQ
jgi:hypothetical protein